MSWRKLPFVMGEFYNANKSFSHNHTMVFENERLRYKGSEYSIYDNLTVLLFEKENKEIVNIFLYDSEDIETLSWITKISCSDPSLKK